ncbi:unnamed protein product [Closterium sp. Naga37s-1]|nr:unnamed protein product [Closterium sp. Naga37s-1]
MSTAPTGPEGSPAGSPTADTTMSDLIGGRYRRIRKLGKGSQGSVWECEDVTAPPGAPRVACKTFPLSHSAIIDIRAEVRALEMVGDHPNVVRLVDFIVDAAAAEVHLADFALSTVVKGGLNGKKTDLGAGTRQYMAPEMDQAAAAAAAAAAAGAAAAAAGGTGVARCDSSGGSYGLKADVWSLGITLCAILTGRLPAVDSATLALHDSLPINFVSPSWKGISADAKSLVRRMLRVNPDQRLSSFEVLEHPWLNQKAVRRLDITARCPSLLFNASLLVPPFQPAACRLMASAGGAMGAAGAFDTAQKARAA